MKFRNLKILRNEVLPLDARTLLGTVRKVNISNIGEGEYYHFGLKRAIKVILREYERMGKSVEELSLLFNIDGLPIFKSSKEGFRIILCSDMNKKMYIP